MRAGLSVLWRLKPVSKPFDQVSHVAFAIWFVLARSSRVAVIPAGGDTNRKRARVP
jgi:hypothetical protein